MAIAGQRALAPVGSQVARDVNTAKRGQRRDQVERRKNALGPSCQSQGLC